MKKAPIRLLIPEAFNYLYCANFKDMTKIHEIWKDIPGYEGLYKVSSIGRIKSLPRNGTINKFKILSHQLSKGYPSLKLCRNNVIVRHTIHRLMAYTFLMDSYFDGAHVNHKNGIPTDNRIENLEWCTPSENAQHAWDNGLCKPARYWLGKTGIENHTSKPILQYDMDMNLIKEHVSATFAAIEINGSRQHISNCCTGTRKSSNGFIWKYK